MTSRAVIDQAGQTLVELLVAATVLLVGIGSTFTVVTRAQRLGNDAQRHEQAIGLAQAEIEQLRAVPYESLGLASYPAKGTPCGASNPQPTNPNDWLSADGLKLRIRTSYRDCANVGAPAGVAADGEPLVKCGVGGVVCGTPTVAPVTTGVPVGAQGTTASVYRFITWRQQTTCTSPSTGCTTLVQASKRISVAVVLDTKPGDGVRKPVWSSTIVTAPVGT